MLQTDITHASFGPLAASFAYKPGPLDGLQTVVISDTMIGLERDGKPDRSISYTNIKRVRFWTTTSRRVVRIGLALEGMDGTKLLLELMDNGMRSDQNHGHEFRRAVIAILDRLQEQRPDLDVNMGVSAGVRLLTFGIGALLGTVSLLMGGAMLQEGEMGIGLTCLIFFVMSAAMAWTSRPGQAVPRVSTKELVRFLRDE